MQQDSVLRMKFLSWNCYQLHRTCSPFLTYKEEICDSPLINTRPGCKGRYLHSEHQWAFLRWGSLLLPQGHKNLSVGWGPWKPLSPPRLLGPSTHTQRHMWNLDMWISRIVLYTMQCKPETDLTVACWMGHLYTLIPSILFLIHTWGNVRTVCRNTCTNVLVSLFKVK